MEVLVAPVSNITFDLETYLAKQVGAQPLPFPGMDKSGAAVCENHVRSFCSKATACPFRHVRGDKSIVCKHWLRGLCKKGDTCEFLHEYDMSKMPECYFYSRFSTCHNQDCPFLHIDAESKIRNCAWYDRGFCRHGPVCHHRHVRRQMCLNYLAGFCSQGAECVDAHPRFEIPSSDPIHDRVVRKIITCHHCGQPGHKVFNCAKITPEMKEAYGGNSASGRFLARGSTSSQGTIQSVYNDGDSNKSSPTEIILGGQGKNSRPYPLRPYQTNRSGALSCDGDGGNRGNRHFRNMDNIICYKCGEKGHFANRCNSGTLSFISIQHNQKEEIDRLNEVERALN